MISLLYFQRTYHNIDVVSRVYVLQYFSTKLNWDNISVCYVDPYIVTHHFKGIYLPGTQLNLEKFSTPSMPKLATRQSWIIDYFVRVAILHMSNVNIYKLHRFILFYLAI